MNLTKAQLQAVGHLTKKSGLEPLYLIRREKIAKVSQPFVSGVVAYDEDGKEVGIEPINSRVIDSLLSRGLIAEVGGDSVNGILYKPAERLLENKPLLDKAAVSFGERAKHSTLAESANKFGCNVVFDRTPSLFKVERQDGRKFTKPYIDVSLKGVKVTRLTDLNVAEWEDEIAEVIKRSQLI